MLSKIQLCIIGINYIKNYIKISAVKISITCVKHFSQFNALKIFNTINAGAELGLATPFNTAVSVTFSLDKKFIYSVPECIYDHIKREMIIS